jgi:hypothetical protein
MNHALFQPPGHFGFDLFLVGELAGGELAVNQVAIAGDLEAAAFAGDELQAGEAEFEPLEQASRQTDGLRLVASGRAIAEMNAHHGPPYFLDFFVFLAGAFFLVVALPATLLLAAFLPPNAAAQPSEYFWLVPTRRIVTSDNLKYRGLLNLAALPDRARPPPIFQLK